MKKQIIIPDLILSITRVINPGPELMNIKLTKNSFKMKRKRKHINPHSSTGGATGS
jgi:hypothetical protein